LLRAEQAEERFQLARRSADEMIEMAEEELADNPHPQLQNLRKRMLEAAVTYYQEFIEQRRDDATAQAELAATRDRVKRLLADLAAMQGAGQIFMLANNAVLDDLELADEQRKKVEVVLQQLTARQQEMFRAFHRLTPDERRARFLEMARANEAVIADLLTPEQVRRLRQISVQWQGPMAFREYDIVLALDLSPPQRELIRSIEAEMMFGKRDGPSPQDMSPEARQKAFEKVADAAMERILAILTEDQIQSWFEIVGKPFTGPRPLFNARPGQFGPPPQR
jgi:hypothetical protein